MKEVSLLSYEPKRVFFEQDALKYTIGRKAFEIFKEKNVELGMLKSHNRVTQIPGKTPSTAYSEGKDTLVFGVRRTLKFETCKPSANYQIPLVTGCMGKCNYCYLNTQLGKKPYMRVYVNIDEILDKALEYTKEREPDLTYFEGAATSDPIPAEPYTKSLFKTIEYFGNIENARFRFVTKFTNVDGLLHAKHNNHTTIRFSVNSDTIITKYENRTPSLQKRIEAAKKIADAEYPFGFIIAPVILTDNWEHDYEELLNEMQVSLEKHRGKNISFEIISHRFTARAKNNINQIFPNNDLPMKEEERKYKYGQFGYGKYVYEKEQLEKMDVFFRRRIKEVFPNSNIQYII